MPADAFRKRGFNDIVSALLAEAAAGEGGRTALTDVSAGSVVRTLMESFARELAVCYEQLEIVHRNAYLDTAEGAALDNVVALLGLERRRAGFLVGAVEFARLLPAEADIAIPAGTLVAGPQAPPCQTTRDAVLAAGERQVRVEVQSVEPSPATRQVPPGALVLMPRPVAGVERVGNGAALLQRQQPETDADLRARARRQVRRSHAGTAAALETAVRACGIAEVKVLEDPVRSPGEVTVVIGDADVLPALLEQAYASVRDVRPAGVRVTVNRATAIAVRVAAVLDLARETPPAEQAAIRARVRSDLEAYVGQLAVGEPLRAAKLRGVLAADDRVVAAGPPPGRKLVEPHVAGVPVAARVQAGNEDIRVAASERVVLDTSEGWPLLVLRLPGLRVDAEIGLKPGQVTARAAVERAATDALAALLSRKLEELEQAARRREAGAATAPAELGFDELARAVAGEAVDAGRLRFTLVHERDGRVAVLARAGERDGLEDGELPRLGGVTGRPAEAGGA